MENHKLIENQIAIKFTSQIDKSLTFHKPQPQTKKKVQYSPNYHYQIYLNNLFSMNNFPNFFLKGN